MAVTTSWTLDAKSRRTEEIYNVYNWSDMIPVPAQEWFDLAGEQFNIRNASDSPATFRARLPRTPEGTARTITLQAWEFLPALFIQIRASTDGGTLPTTLTYCVGK